MEVWIEAAIAENFIVDAALLAGSASLLGFRIRRARTCLAALLGTAFALVYPLFSYPKLVAWLLRAASGAALCAIACGERGLRQNLRFVGIFFLLSALLAGAAYALPVGGVLAVALALAALPVCVRAARRCLFRRREVVSYLYVCELTLGGKSVRVRGFLDTGNRLRFHGKPMCILSAETFAELVDFSKNGHTAFEKFSLSTVNGRRETYVISADSLKIYSDEQVHTIEKIPIGLSAARLSDEYELLLHPACLEGGRYAP